MTLARRICAALRELGAEIVAVRCVIDREAGGAANLAERGLELRALFRMRELGVHLTGQD